MVTVLPTATQTMSCPDAFTLRPPRHALGQPVKIGTPVTRFSTRMWTRPAPVAQWIEQPPPKRKVASSTLAWGTTSRATSSRLHPNAKGRQLDSGLGHTSQRRAAGSPERERPPVRLWPGAQPQPQRRAAGSTERERSASSTLAWGTTAHQSGASGPGSRQPRPGVHAELRVDVAEVVADRLDAEHELLGDLLVGQPLAHQGGDGPLLRGQLLGQLDGAPGRGDSAGGELLLDATDERPRTQGAEPRLGVLEPVDGRALLAASPQEPAEGGLAERGIERRDGAMVELERRLEGCPGDLVVPSRGGELASDAGEPGKP